MFKFAWLQTPGMMMMPAYKSKPYFKVRYLTGIVIDPPTREPSKEWSSIEVINEEKMMVPQTVGEDIHKYSRLRDAFDSAVMHTLRWDAIFGRQISNHTILPAPRLTKIEYPDAPLLLAMSDIVLYDEVTKGPLRVLYRMIPAKYRVRDDKESAEVAYVVEKGPWPCPVWAGDMNRFQVENSASLVAMLLGSDWVKVAKNKPPLVGDLYRRYRVGGKSEVAQIIAIDGGGIDDPIPSPYLQIMKENLIDDDETAKLIFAREDREGTDYFIAYTGPAQELRQDEK